MSLTKQNKIFHFTGVCSNCRKLLVEAEKMIADRPSENENEVILQIGNISLVSRCKQFLV